jgi:transcriptional regulator with XRE-family HTH domain
MATTDGPGPFGLLLRQYRAAAGLSQEELAERAGLSKRGISDLERGQRRSPHPATVRRLAEALDLDGAERAAWLSSVAVAAHTSGAAPASAAGTTCRLN